MACVKWILVRCSGSHCTDAWWQNKEIQICSFLLRTVWTTRSGATGQSVNGALAAWGSLSGQGSTLVRIIWCSSCPPPVLSHRKEWFLSPESTSKAPNLYAYIKNQTNKTPKTHQNEKQNNPQMWETLKNQKRKPYILTYSLQFCRYIFLLRPAKQSTEEHSFTAFRFPYILVLCLLWSGIILHRTTRSLFPCNVNSQITAV